MKLLKHLTGYMPVSLAKGLVGFGSVYVFTRLLGGEAFGRYALMYSYFALIHTLTVSWVEAAGFRYAGKAAEDGDLPDHYRTGLVLIARTLVFAALGLGILWVYYRDDPNYTAIIPWLFGIMAVNGFGQIALEAHRAHQRVSRYALTETFHVITGFMVGAGVAYYYDFGAIAPFIGLFVGGSMILLREGVWLLKAAKGGKTSLTRNRAWMMFGIPVAMAMMLDILLSVSDRFLIDHFLGEAAVGAYAAGYGVADKPVLMICAWAGLSASPIMMAAFEEEGKAAASKAARGLFNAILFLGLPAAFGLAFVAEPLAEAVIAPDLSMQAASIIPFIAFSGLLNGLLIHYVSESFQLVRKTEQRALLMIFPVVLNIALNLVFLPKLGLMGAVYATLISYGFAVLLLGYFGRRLLVLPVPLLEIARTGFAALCMWPMIKLMPDLAPWPELLLKVIAGGSVYILVAVLLDAGGTRGQIRTRLKRKGVEDV